MQLRASIADEINQHHEIAIARADEAIHHASEAGKLLLEVKAALPHGQFLAWVQQHVRVSVRQAQRYMAVAEGKPAPIRALGSKSDTVSHLPELADPSPAAWPAPTWWPLAGHWMSTVLPDAAYWVVPALKHPGFFHVSKFYSSADPLPVNEGKPAPVDWDGESYFDGTRRPVRADVVEAFLKHLGLTDPAGASWDCIRREGLERPFGEPEGR